MAGQGRLDYEIDGEIEASLITAHPGVPNGIKIFRRTGAAAVVDRAVNVKHRQRGPTNRRWSRPGAASLACAPPYGKRRGGRGAPPGSCRVIGESVRLFLRPARLHHDKTPIAKLPGA